MNAEQIAEWLAAGHSAAKIAELAGVHLRTAYKLIARHKPPAPAAALPPDFDRAAALNAAIDRAVFALGAEGPAAAEQLLALARSAKMLGLRPHVAAPADREAIRESLRIKMEQAAREAYQPPAPAAPPPAEPPPAAPPPAAPDENPWLASLKVPRKPHHPAGNNPDYHEAKDRPQGPVTKAPAEPPTPTSLMTKPLSR